MNSSMRIAKKVQGNRRNGNSEMRQKNEREKLVQKKCLIKFIKSIVSENFQSVLQKIN